MNKIPLFGWILSLVFNISLAVPFWICWNACGIGASFFPFLPAAYLGIGFWQCVGLFTVLSILKGFIPTLVSSSSKIEAKESKK